MLTESNILAVLAALPWLLVPLAAALRLGRSRDLRDESPVPPPNPPKVSVIIPARNEARNIAACMRSVLQTNYPRIELIIVNDHSDDGTETIAAELAQADSRVQVIQNPDLPRDWFGKQWACHNGSLAASGDLLLFVDADTQLKADAIPRAVNGMQRTQADLYTVLSFQEMHTFWEKLLQPQIFFMLGLRYGGSETINKSKRIVDKIASGQFLMFRRSTYDAMQGHALVRTYVAEDLRFAQLYYAARKKTVVVHGIHDVMTRMYTTLPEIIRGWRKNVYAGGRDAVPFGKFGQWIFPVALPSTPLFQLIPVTTLLATLTCIAAPSLQLWAELATSFLLIYWALSYLIARQSPLYAFTFPLSAAVTLYILLSAIARGNNVSWKNRDYINTHPQ